MSVHETSPAPLRMMQMLTGFWTSMSLYVAAKLELADLLKDGPRTVEDLARATRTEPRALYRLLRGLASQGVFAADDEGRFGLTELAECLRSDVPHSQRALAMMMGDEHYRAWGELEYSVRTGGTAFEQVFGKPIFDYLGENPDAAMIFDQAMVGVHGKESPAICDAYDFSGLGTVVDIGGGNGSLIQLILQRNPGLQGILYDLPHVVERAKNRLAATEIASRCQAIGGNFFEQIPEGGDAYLLRHIIHDWDEEKCRTILGHIRKVIKPAGKVLIIEAVVPAGNEPSFSKMMDLNMLVIPGGQERTESEYGELYGKCGFRMNRVIPTRSDVHIIEGVPA